MTAADTSEDGAAPAAVEQGKLPPEELAETADEEEVRDLRKGLQVWLNVVATFHQVETMALLREWLLHAPAEKVDEELSALLKKDDSASWSTCAIEDEPCDCPSGKIRYGHPEKSWIPKNGKKALQCALGTFGGRDVAVGMLKSCQCYTEMGPDGGVSDLRAVAKSAASDARKPPLKRFRIPAQQEQTFAVPARKPEERGWMWERTREVARWYVEQATRTQLLCASRVYMWLDNTQMAAKVSGAVAQASAKAVSKDSRRCADGSAVDPKACPSFGEVFCRAGCVKGAAPIVAAEAADAAEPSPPKPRSELCASGEAVERLWSCDSVSSRNPNRDHKHAEAQFVMDKATEGMCKDGGDIHAKKQLAVYLECDFVENYLRWTSDESEWIDEGFVTYVGGPKGSTYEWQAVNLVRSVDVFSTRPIVVVVFGHEFVPPAVWRTMPNVIVYRMLRGIAAISFNFNKLRSMISSRICVGIQLDTDQLVAPGIDDLFRGTRREINQNYPWIMLPVHWMSREGVKGNPYMEYAFHGWEGKRTLRWGHAHPTWSFWAVPFICDTLHERLAARFGRKIPVWKLTEAVDRGLMVVLKENLKSDRHATNRVYMSEDEDMMNVALWRDKATKDWCKFDLEWGMYKDRLDIDRELYWDKVWYPKGVPVIFISMHNTKQFESTDWLLSLIAKCDWERPRLDNCPRSTSPPRYCQAGSTDERRQRARPSEYLEALCCCYQPRQSTNVYFNGKWYDQSSKVPMQLGDGSKKNRTCKFP